MSLQFTWEDLWAYHATIVESEIKAHLEEEVVGQDWLYRQSAKEQKKILQAAPREFVDRIASSLRPEVQIELGMNPYLKRR